MMGRLRWDFPARSQFNMLRFRVFLAVAALFAAAALLWRASPRVRDAQPSRAAASGAAPTVLPRAAAPVANRAVEKRAEALRNFAYGQSWNDELPPALAAFREWTARYHAASSAQRTALEAEGITRATARRPEMRALIVSDPERALAVTVPAMVRQELPAAVLALLEQRVAGTGDFGLQAMSYEGARPADAPATRRIVFLEGETYTAHAYGRRRGQTTKEGASLHGIALDREFALHESPLRVLEPGELTLGAAQEHCPVSGAAVPEIVAATGANRDDLNLVEAHGKIWEFCSGEAMLEQLQQRLEAAEESATPRVAPLTATGGSDSTPATAADAPTTWTLGVKKLLVIRVDFSDFPGDPVPADTIGATLNGTVNAFFDEASYGQSGMNATVTSSVYRMPRTGATYATTDNSGQLNTDARAAAAADYRIADYDRVMVVFGNLGTARVPGSSFTWSGLALVNGSTSWINNAFTMRTMAHELGHNHGLKHSSLWVVPSGGSPVSALGTSREYGDPFDVMGDASDRDGRHHYNQWCKNLLGWLPDASVANITRSGTYRVYRFDGKAAYDGRTTAATRPLALRIFRDGVRWYWVGYRQNFPTNNALNTGANILWGFNALQESQLIDCTTPGANALDSALAIGATLDDPVSGVKIRPLARGGAEPDQWLDVEVTVRDAPPNQVAAWGGGQNFLDEPAAITNVPLDLAHVAAIAVGTSHVLALKTDGTLTGWGDRLLGQLTFPQLSEKVISIAAGGNVSGAVTRDGKVALWGLTTSLTPPSDLSDVRQLAIGTNHVVALKNDGTLVGWGSDAAGQLAFGNIRDVVAIAAGTQTTVVLKRDGTVAAFGGATIRGVPAGLSEVTAIAARGTHGLALRSDSTVIAWGNNGNGQINVPAGLRDVIAVAAGDFHSMALRSDGSIIAWGSSANAKTTVPANLPRARAIVGSAQASFALVGPQVFVTTQPVAQTVASGSAVTLNVDAIAPGPLTYQWRRDGVPLAGATSSTLTLSSVTSANVGAYDVVVSDGSTTQITTPARVALIVAPTGPQVARISNLSILTSLASRTDTFRMGFVVGGDGTSGRKPVVIRAVGPSLGVLGIPFTLGDPTLEVFTGSSRLGGNDNWGGAIALTNAMSAVGAFPFAATSSLDAALAVDINGRDNSAVVGSGPGGAASGLVIAEIYDATPSAQFVASVPRLINVSVLKNIGSMLTAGFVVAGPEGATKRVLVRAIGPGLTAFGFTSGFVADPQLVLYGPNSQQIAANNDWGGGAELTTAFNAVGAFTLPANSRDAALVATLQPGDHSVVVTPAAGATGTALIEIYEVP